eukprot:2918294-Prymnesium_polylepis.1
MPFLSTTSEAELSHFAPSFPWSCPCCPYKVTDQAEQDDNVAEMEEARAMKSKKGRAAWAARVKQHCEAHQQYMEFQKVILSLGSLDNLVDLLHGLDINLPEKIMKFAFHDP